MRRLIFLTAAAVILFSACDDSPETELSPGQFYEILRTADSSKKLPKGTIERLDPYESYYLALKSYESARFDLCEPLARHCWQNSEGYIVERAAELIIRAGLDSGDYASAEFYASLAAAQFPQNYYFHRAAAEAEYWQHEDESVLDALERLSVFREAAADGELALFKAVSSCRLEADGWKDDWVRLFRTADKPEYIRRGWDYLTAVSDADFEDFGANAELFRGRYLHAVDELDEAAEAYELYLESGGAVSAAVIYDIEQLHLRNGSAYRGGALIEQYAADDPDMLFAAARLYRRSGRYAAAEKCMRRLIELRQINAAGPSDRLLWYLFDIVRRRDLSAAVELLDYCAENWTDPEYFDDTLDNLCTSLAARRRWRSIAVLAGRLEQSGPAAAYDRCRYITERAVQMGWLDADEAGFSVPYTTNYYRILTGDSLDELGMQNDSRKLSIVCKSLPEELTPEERYIEGLLRYEAENTLDEVRRLGPKLSEAFLVYAAAQTADTGEHLDSIRMMYQYGGRYSAAGYSALYPDLYRPELEAAAAANDIPAQLLFALVWKESGFENDIVSHSGAIGLSQLMPTTAEDVARRQRKDVLDLTDPVENLELGSWYLDWLIGYVGNTAAAVLSYNGGPGRVKGWQRAYRELPDDLLYEVVPVPETHYYGKKVLEAAVIYGMLYYDEPPENTLKIFFY